MARAANTDKRAPARGAGTRPAAGKSRRWVLLLLVSAWMFVLGVLVGRGTAPVHFDTEALQKELASLREAVLTKEKSRFRIFDKNASAEKAENLEFYENLKKAPPEKPAPAAASAPKPKPAPKPPPKDPAAGTQTAARPAPIPKPAGLGTGEVPASEKPFTIQVASLKEAKTADAMVERLRARGFPAYRERADIEGKGTWHRVRIGSFTGRAEAARTLDRLKSAKLSPILIRK